jgi:tyrosyl-tRNA synthetase
VNKIDFGGDGMPMADMVAAAGLTQSKGEARRLIQGGGIYVNNQRVNDVKRLIKLEDSIEGQAIILRKGQKEYRLVRIS